MLPGGEWLGSATVEADVPTIVLANVDGVARILGSDSWRSGSFSSSAARGVGKGTAVTEGSLVSVVGSLCADGGVEGAIGFAARPRDPELSVGFVAGFPLAASLSRRDGVAPPGAGDDASERSD